MRGWLLVIKASDSDDPVAGEAWARQAHEFARTAGDLDLEFCAASQVGPCSSDRAGFPKA
jgi:hypothetical protein